MRPLLIPALLTLLSTCSTTGAWAAPEGRVKESAAPRVSNEPEPPAEATPPTTVREVIARERRALAVERAELEQLRIDLVAAEAELDEKMKALDELRKKRANLLDKIKAARQTIVDEKIERLVKLVEKMPPGNAALYLATLDEPTATTILQGMRVRQAAKVLAALAPEKAAALSRMYLKDDQPVGHRATRDKSRR